MHYHSLRRIVTVALVYVLLITVLPLNLAVPQASAAITPYTITDLGSLGGRSTSPKAINAIGQIVGSSSTYLGDNHAFLWQNGAMTDLDAFGSKNGSANDINDAGQIVGIARTPDGLRGAFLWQNGAMTNLGNLGGYLTAANGINAAGVVVGEAVTDGDHGSNGGTASFLWQGGAMRNLNYEGNGSFATGINGAGQIIGGRLINSGLTSVAYLGTTNGQHTMLAPNMSSSANDINDAGQVVGDAPFSNGSHPVLWHGGTTIDLGVLGTDSRGGSSGTARGINSLGQVVGGSSYPGNSGYYYNQHAFLWKNGTLVDLNTFLASDTKWKLYEATAINDSGQIVGFGTYNGEPGHAFLLTPTTSSPSPSPSPSPLPVGTETITLLPEFTTPSLDPTPVVPTGHDVIREGIALFATVRDSADRPVPNRAVTLRDTTNGSGGQALTKTTNASGFFTFRVNSPVPETRTYRAEIPVYDGLNGPTGRVRLSNEVSIRYVGVKKRYSEEEKAYLREMSDAWKGFAVDIFPIDFFPSADPTPPGAALCATLKEQPYPELVVACAAGAVSVSAGSLINSVHFARLARDPADPNFREIAQPINHALAIQPIAPTQGLTPQAAAALNAFLGNQGQIGALAEAILTAINRAQGAYEAGDTAWEFRQMDAAHQYAAQLATLLEAEPALRTGAAAAFAGIGAGGRITAADVAQYQTQIVREGLPATLRQALVERGADTGMLEEIRAAILTTDPDRAAALGGGDILRAFTDPALLSSIRQAASGLRAFAASPSFADVPTDYWAHDQIGQFAARGITTGCGDDDQGQRLYCPERGVTRAEMATFITRTLGQDKAAPPATPTFADVPTDYWAYGQIEAFAKLGITTGCGLNDLGQRIFCPDRGVTRAEMAAFIDRAKGQAELASGSPTFADVPTDYWAYGWIERFFTLGVTTGCGVDDSGKKVYCPDRGVTRAEMAVFITRAYP